MEYIDELRSLVGTRPLNLTGVTVLVIDRDGRFLMVQNKDKSWKLPGGFMELGEAAEETGRREILEETGISIGSLQLIGVYSGKNYFTKLPNGDEYFPICIAYMTDDVLGGDLEPDYIETHKVKYFKWSELPKNLSERDRQIFQSFITNLILAGKRT